MYCNKCGEQIDDTSRFCSHCGAAQSPEIASIDDSAPAKSEHSQPASLISDEIKKPDRRSWIPIGALVIIVLLVLISQTTAIRQTTPTATETDSTAAGMNALEGLSGDNSMPALEGLTEKPAEPWTYRTDVDKVRGASSYYASTTSTNTVRQSQPYDSDTTMTIVVRRQPSDGLNVLLQISSGQLMCPSYDGCSGTVRFDDGPAERVSFNGASDNSSEVIFVKGAASFLAKLRTSKRVIVEKTLYQAGEAQFEFDTVGLKWDH